MRSFYSVARAVAPFLSRPLTTASGPAAAAPKPGPDSATILYGTLSTFTAGLCVWQLYRYGWKQSILAERRALLGAPSIDISVGP